MKERFECLEFALKHNDQLRHAIAGGEALSIFELAELVFEFWCGKTGEDIAKSAKSIQHQRIIEALEQTKKQYPL